MTQKFANAARAYLVSTISDSETTVTIVGGGSLFPAIASPEFSRAVLQDSSGIEVVLITAHTANSNSFTVTRAQEGTTARSFAAGSVFGLRMTAADGDTFAAKVSGPGSATNNALAAFDGTTGKLIKQAATVTVAQGGTGETTRQAAMDALAGAVTSGQYLRGNGTDVVMSAIQAADVPTLNQNTTGTAANVTGTVAVANGGTGRTSLTANSIVLGNNTSAVNFVAPGAIGNVLTSDGTTWTSATPAAGGGTALLEYSQVISTNYTVTSGKNALAIGPVTINTGISVTVGTDQNWLVLNEGQL